MWGDNKDMWSRRGLRGARVSIGVRILRSLNSRSSPMQLIPSLCPLCLHVAPCQCLLSPSLYFTFSYIATFMIVSRNSSCLFLSAYLVYSLCPRPSISISICVYITPLCLMAGFSFFSFQCIFVSSCISLNLQSVYIRSSSFKSIDPLLFLHCSFGVNAAVVLNAQVYSPECF
ncbi:uncharacterized protein BJ212DRAFT_69090 [Suillus subaureus]|uniref:Uncharacterized protein n=1 Tax=Suillus subaureus TaxID=48587 RepID=A0A9P7EEP0_9AGAM|nr:uncharacterized protein BJ212DRAFT_69090 [Suillus subaureus]KAG1819030.1 hypothetical protein BJ212DRAFT_69090 [Suillus subaureus]